MPKMSGLELASEIIALRQNLPIILCTGFNERITTAQSKAFGIKSILEKPVSQYDLIHTIRKALDESNRLTFELGGMVWKGEAGAQRLTMDRMDPATAELIRRVKGLLDPNGIMNPGNWDMG